MELKQLYPGVYFLKFKNQYEVTMSMLRFQEFYESPYKEIRNEYFTLELAQKARKPFNLYMRPKLS